MEYLKVAKINDFTDQNIKSFSLLGKKLGIIKNPDGTFHGIEVACKHQGADLTKGEIKGYVATCYRHQWKYDLQNGNCLNHDSPNLRKYHIDIRGEDIYISISPIE